MREETSSGMASTDEPPLYHHLHDASVQHQHQHQPQPLSSRPSLPMTPPELDHDRDLLNDVGEVTEDLDKLVHRLNRRPILQDSLRWHGLDKEGVSGETEGTREEMAFQCEGPDALCTQMSMQLQPSEPTPVLDPIPELSMSCDPCPSTIPPLCDTLQPPGPIHFNHMVADPLADDKSLSKTNDAKRPRRATDVRLHKSASNLRMLGLVTGMIENGVQCNVQNSTPPSPTGTSSTTSLAVPASMRYIEPQDPIDSHLLPGRMQLEVDMGFSELDEETMLNDNLALRHASTPAGIRKFGFLRYRSSTEAAQSCKNMKKSAPRMRRRLKSNSKSASGPSTSQPSSSAA
ncbi:hypothetical protein ANO14919_056620 [Xylariales sp. No.14919]|nr:hypothetical protein ANO14919_056620 [Xylariales sp. No.14919]